MPITANNKTKNKMRAIFLTFALGTIVLFSCNNNKSFINGSWTMDNLNSQDTSANREALFGTFITTNYSDKNILTFSSDKVVMTTADGKELGKGDFKLIDNDSYLTIKFPSDNMESKYKIVDKSDKTIKLSATDNGEMVNISLTRREK
jgi:hypothetical protein